MKRETKSFVLSMIIVALSIVVRAASANASPGFHDEQIQLFDQTTASNTTEASGGVWNNIDKFSVDFVDTGAKAQPLLLTYSTVPKYGLGNRLVITIPASSLFKDYRVRPSDKLFYPNLLTFFSKPDEPLPNRDAKVTDRDLQVRAPWVIKHCPRDVYGIYPNTTTQILMETPQQDYSASLLDLGKYNMLSNLEAVDFDDKNQTFTLYFDPHIINDTRYTQIQVKAGDNILVGMWLYGRDGKLVKVWCGNNNVKAAPSPSQTISLADTVYATPAPIVVPSKRPFEFKSLAVASDDVRGKATKQSAVVAKFALDKRYHFDISDLYLTGSEVLSSQTGDTTGQLELKAGYETPRPLDAQRHYSVRFCEAGLLTNEAMTQQQATAAYGYRLSRFTGLPHDYQMLPATVDSIEKVGYAEGSIIGAYQFRQDPTLVVRPERDLVGARLTLSSMRLEFNPLRTPTPLAIFEATGKGYLFPFPRNRGGLKDLGETTWYAKLGVRIPGIFDKNVHVTYTSGANEADGYAKTGGTWAAELVTTF